MKKYFKYSLIFFSFYSLNCIYSLNINEPLVGPIVKITDSNKIRISAFDLGQKNKKKYMISRIRESNNKSQWSKLYMKEVRINKNYGEFIEFNNLSPGKRYDYQLGFLENPLMKKSGEEIYLTDDKVWDNLPIYNTRTYDDKSSEYTFAFGSCRHFLQLLGVHFNDLQESDESFKSINKLIRNGQRIDSLYMLGDQIYTDTVKYLPWLRHTKFKSIKKLYEGAKNTTGLKKLSSLIETLEIPDDHEYRDNGSTIKSEEDSFAYNNAVDNINIYEHPFGPYIRGQGKVMDYGMVFDRSPASIFLCDSRFSRVNKPLQIMNKSQMNKLTKWILNPKQSFSILATPISFALQKYEDTWFGFNKSTQDVLKALENSKMKKLFVLTGDSHSSCSSEFNLSRLDKSGNWHNTKKNVVEIMSSSFYQHFHDDKNNFHDKRMINNIYKLESVESLKSIRDKVIEDNNFAVVNVNSNSSSKKDKEHKKELEVTYYKDSGEKISSYKYSAD